MKSGTAADSGETGWPRPRIRLDTSPLRTGVAADGSMASSSAVRPHRNVRDADARPSATRSFVGIVKQHSWKCNARKRHRSRRLPRRCGRARVQDECRDAARPYSRCRRRSRLHEFARLDITADPPSIRRLSRSSMSRSRRPACCVSTQLPSCRPRSLGRWAAQRNGYIGSLVAA